MASIVTVAPGVVTEALAKEILVVVPGQADVIRLTGAAADVVMDVQAGKTVDPSSLVVSDLVDLGVVSVSGVSRRNLIRVGAVGAGAGIAVLAMPSVAAASSTGDNSGGDPIQLSGIWALQMGGIVLFRIRGALELPTDLGQWAFNSGDPYPNNGPSGLTSLPAGFGDADPTTASSNGVFLFGADGSLDWKYPFTAGTPSGPYSGSFTWNDQPYSATFSPV